MAVFSGGVWFGKDSGGDGQVFPAVTVSGGQAVITTA